MATTTIQEIYNKAPAASTGGDDILLIAQNEATKGVKLKDVTAGKSVNAEYAAHLGTEAAPLKVGTRGVPVYFDKNGVPQPCDNIQATIAKDMIAQSTDIGTIEFDRVLIISAENEIVLTIGDGSYAGIEVKIINTTDKIHTIRGTTSRDGDSTLLPHQIQTIIWNGSKWEGLSCPRIGEVYVQYPQQEAPQDLFICTKWVLQEQYAGAFFRATGGNATAFIEKTGELTAQLDAFQAHQHSYQGNAGLPMDSGQYRIAGWNTQETAKIVKDKSGDYGEPRYANETRPLNFTVNLWLRTA